jgi:transcriptional regulator with XRE-family HTH domain
VIEDLRKTLKVKGISQRQFALKIGVGTDAVCNWLQYKRTPSMKYRHLIELFLIENQIKEGRKKGDKYNIAKRIRGHFNSIFKRGGSGE